MRVLHCIWSGGVGGISRSIHQLSREQLQDPDLEPAVLFAQDKGPYVAAMRELGCQIEVADVAHGYSLPALPALAARMREFDVHHFHAAEPLVMAASMRCGGARRVFTQRAGVDGKVAIDKRIRYAVTGALLRRGFDVLCANSRHAAECAARLYRLDARDFNVVYNGFDFGSLEPQRPPEPVRRELGLAADDFVLGTAANLKRWKRVDRLLDLVASAPDERLRLLIVGDGEMRGELESRAAREGLNGRVVFAGMQERIGDYLQVMDAFCLPSSSRETFGNAVVEAMSQGVPAIVFADGGGMVEHIDPGQTGFIVRDAADLRDAVTVLLRDEARREEMAARGRDRARRYSISRTADAYRQLYLAAPAPG